MGLYTKYEQKWIDEAIDLSLKNVALTLAKNVDGIKSIMVLGGYGRGEGSIILNGSHGFKLVNDLDLAAIVDKSPHENTIKKIEREIKKALDDLSNSIKVPSTFEVDIRYLKPSQLDFPDIWFYDLKARGKVVYGKDLREKVSYAADDIPLSSGFRILFQKVTALLKSFSYRYINGEEIGVDEYEFMVYASLKTFVEIGTTLCILAKKYRPGYSERVQVVRNIYYEEFGELASQIPNLPDLVQIGTEFKLRPDYKSLSHYFELADCKDAIDLWFKARDVLMRYIIFYVSRFAGTPLVTIDDLPKVCEILAKVYYTPMLWSLIRKKPLCSQFSMVKLLNIAYQFILNVQYVKNVAKETRALHLTPLLKPISPSLKFYPAGALILSSLQKDGSIKDEYIRKALNVLRYCVPIDRLNEVNGNEWDKAKTLYFRAFDLYEGMR